MFECTARLRIGFIVDTGSVISLFRVELPELSHMEKRWNPNTGIRVPDVKVVYQEAGSIIQVGDAVYDDDSDANESQDLLDDIVQVLKLKCEVELMDEGRCIFHVEPRGVEPDIDSGVITCSGPVSFQAVENLRPKLNALKSRLKKAGIASGEAQVVVVGRVED